MDDVIDYYWYLMNIMLWIFTNVRWIINERHPCTIGIIQNYVY